MRGQEQRAQRRQEHSVSRERVGSNAFNVEYERNRFDNELRDDIVSYLGEYRFQLQKYDYELVYSRGEDGVYGLRDPHRRELMKTKAQRSIAERKHRGQPVHREEAEDHALTFLDGALQSAKTGDTLLWGSPPGPKEEGYGEYGFIYAGDVIDVSPTEKRLKMTAFRVEKPTLDQYNSAFSFITGKQYAFFHADQYLQHPTVVEGGIDKRFVERVIGRLFSEKHDENQSKVFGVAIGKMEPLIRQFIQLTKFGTKEEKLQSFYALENYAIKLKEQYESEGKIIFIDDGVQNMQLMALRKQYGYQPPEVKGSCGNTGNIQSNSLLSNGFEALRKAIFDNENKIKEWFTCPRCPYEATGPIGGTTCPGCGLTQAQYEEEGGEVC